ncbi:DUF262 domain-containing protein [Aeromonas veronii]
MSENIDDINLVNGQTEGNNDVEQEDLGPTSITHPFDPHLIKINFETINLGSIIENIENDEIDLSPAFQRKSGLWTDTQKSRLIESLILGLPLPTFFFALETRPDNRTIETSDNQHEDKKNTKLMLLVVDGLQRLCTIKEFMIDKTLRLSNLEFLNETHDNASYDDLSREEHRKIKGSRITCANILEGNPPLVKFIIFRRINTGGLTLNEQEIRHALNQGKPADFLNKLARSREFLLATSKVIKSDRMLDREFVNRFLAFYMLGEKKYGGEIDLFLADALSQLSNMPDETFNAIERRFTKSMFYAFEIFGEDAFRKTKTKGSLKRKPISKALFDTISVNLARLDDIDLELLLKNKNYLVEEYDSLIQNDADFLRSISNATGTIPHVNIRFSKIHELIKKVIEK